MELDRFRPTAGAGCRPTLNWWGGKVPIQHISVKVFSNETSLELAMRAGEIDLDPYILDTKAFASASGATLLTAPSCSLGVFSMNTQTAPWSDIHVRRTVAYALNRSDIITAAGGYNTPIYTYLPPSAFLELAAAPEVNSLIELVATLQVAALQSRPRSASRPIRGAIPTRAVMSEYNYGSSINISEESRRSSRRSGSMLE